MKKIAVILLCSLTSCVSTNSFSKVIKIKQCAKNIEVLENWLNEDYNNGDIPIHVAQNYIHILTITKEDLKKLQTKYDNK